MKLKLKKYWFDCFVYISIIFLFFALYKEDYLIIPEIYSINYLLLSFLALFSGFILMSIAWRQILNRSNFPVSQYDSISSVGLSIFGKYIPGKVWTFVGQTGYIVKKYNYPKNALSTIIINTVFIFIWVGLILSAFSLFLINQLHLYGSIILIIWIITSFIIFTTIPHKIIEVIIQKILKRDIQIFKLSLSTIIRIVFWHLLCWICWCLGFYFLTQSLTINHVSINVGFGFSLGGTLGILAIIAPGGIGIRESILAGYLTLSGLDIQIATTISVASRLWFLVGECFIFCIGFILNKRINKITF